MARPRRIDTSGHKVPIRETFMNAAKLFGLSLLAGLLVLSGPALAQTKKTDQKADAKKASDDKIIADGKQRTKHYSDDWEKTITPWIVHAKSNRECQAKDAHDKDCNDIVTATDLIKLFAKQMSTIVCDPNDKAKTLPNHVEEVFTQKGKAETQFSKAFKLTVQAPCTSKGLLDVKLTPSFYNK
jgi:hypothetical protein